jgi:hypothetical protein
LGRYRKMPTIQEKTARLQAAREKVESFIAAGGDLKSAAAVPLGMELVLAANEVGIELGYNILQPVKKPVDFIRPDPATQR